MKCNGGIEIQFILHNILIRFLKKEIAISNGKELDYFLILYKGTFNIFYG